MSKEANDEFKKGIRLAVDQRNEEAVAAFNEAIRLQPDYVNAYYQKGWL